MKGLYFVKYNMFITFTNQNKQIYSFGYFYKNTKIIL